MGRKPKKPKKQYFAHSVIRAMTKEAAGMTIEGTGIALVSIVAMQEDAVRYSKPVTFWNSQLSTILGFKSVGSFRRIRALCVKHGWLDYAPKKTRKPGLYSAKIPKEYADFQNDIVTECIGFSDDKVTESNQSQANKPTNDHTNDELMTTPFIPIPNNLLLTKGENGGTEKGSEIRPIEKESKEDIFDNSNNLKAVEADVLNPEENQEDDMPYYPPKPHEETNPQSTEDKPKEKREHKPIYHENADTSEKGLRLRVLDAKRILIDSFGVFEKVAQELSESIPEYFRGDMSQWIATLEKYMDWMIIKIDTDGEGWIQGNKATALVGAIRNQYDFSSDYQSWDSSRKLREKVNEGKEASEKIKTDRDNAQLSFDDKMGNIPEEKRIEFCKSILEAVENAAGKTSVVANRIRKQYLRRTNGAWLGENVGIFKTYTANVIPEKIEEIIQEYSLQTTS